MKYTFCLLLLLMVNEIRSQTQYMTSFDKTKIAYTDEGRGMPVLLIHGFINDGSMWNKSILKGALLESGYRVIVPDLRGNGKSDRPEEDEAYDNNSEIRDLQQLIEHLGLSHLYAVGYSRGSILLAELLTEDDRITKAVLGGMGIDFVDPKWDRRIMFMNAFDGKVNEETIGAVDYANSVGANLKALHLLQKYQPSPSRSELKKIRAEVLVIAGDLDLDNGDPKELNKAIPHSILQITPGEHNNTYKTESFSKSVVRFLN
ncbi:alpha/beta fold hydrolase [Flagellimonas flava]|nr:alpha/beta hydrolase [Allomuricauda flava]